MCLTSRWRAYNVTARCSHLFNFKMAARGVKPALGGGARRALQQVHVAKRRRDVAVVHVIPAREELAVVLSFTTNAAMPLLFFSWVGPF